jgi:PAS domain-containing protein
MKSWTRNEIGLFDINFETGECYWSFELKRMLGVRHDVPAEFHLLLQRIHPGDRRAFCRTAMQPFRVDCPRHSSTEFRVVHNDGRVHWLHTERRTIVREDDSGEVVRIVGFMLEIAAPRGLLCAA